MTNLDEIWGIFDQLMIGDKKEVEENDINICKKCKSDCIMEDYKSGTYVCLMCGLTKKEKIIDASDETVNYQNDDNNYNKKTPRSMYINSLYPKSSLSTIISGNSKLSKMNQWNNIPYNEKVLMEISELFRNKCSKFNVPNNIINETILMFKNIDEMKKINGAKEIHRGKVREGLLSACLYYSFKKENVIRTPMEISEIMNLEIMEVTRGCKLYLNIINENEDINDIAKPSDFLIRFGSKLNISYMVLNRIGNIMAEIMKLNILTKCTPLSIVTGTIYFTLHHLKINLTIKEISEICKVSEVTINKIFKILNKFKTHLMSI